MGYQHTTITLHDSDTEVGFCGLSSQKEIWLEIRYISLYLRMWYLMRSQRQPIMKQFDGIKKAAKFRRLRSAKNTQNKRQMRKPYTQYCAPKSLKECIR